MKNKLLLILYLLLVISCHDSKKDKISDLVKEWDGKEIQFPAHSVFTLQGKDTVDFDHSHSTYKIVMYVDSVGCISCKLQLAKWKEFMQEVDSIEQQKNDVSLVFYFNSKDYKELRYTLRRDHFNYPICLDKQDEFNKLNHFPSEMAFQTFLLNSDNKVIAIGNPIHNSKVKELYLSLLKGDTLSSEKPILTEAKLDFNYLDLGKFAKNSTQAHKINLKNIGTEPLVIQGVNTSCGCTKVEFDKKPIPVGGETTLKIIYDADETGHFRKTVDVHCNIASSPLRIILTGEVED